MSRLPAEGAVVIEFTAPRTVAVVNIFDVSDSTKESGAVAHLQTLYSAVSPGTELLVYLGEIPNDISVDNTFSSLARPFQYPCRYGYAVVANVTLDETGTFEPGTPVFAFREHTSHFREQPSVLLPIPTGISSLDAVFLPNVETALSLIMDAAVLPGETICVVGQGIVGLLTVAAFRLLHPYSTVVTLDINASRRELSVTAAGAQASFDPTAPDFLDCMSIAMASRADVSIDVSGSGSGLQTAIDATRDHGRVVIGSWFGAKEVTLPRLGGRFHRSHISLIASQVSEVPPHIGCRWTKKRRFDLVWQLLSDIKPSQKFPIHLVSIEKAPEVYHEIADSKHLQVIFQYQHVTSRAR